MTGAQRKAAMAAAERDRNRMSYGSRVVVHTDLAEAQPNQDGVIELPPTYSAGRAPLSLQSLQSLNASGSDINLNGSTYPPPESTTFTYGSSVRSPMLDTPVTPYDYGHGSRWS